jgi:hypothetical protein
VFSSANGSFVFPPATSNPVSITKTLLSFALAGCAVRHIRELAVTLRWRLLIGTGRTSIPLLIVLAVAWSLILLCAGYFRAMPGAQIMGMAVIAIAIPVCLGMLGWYVYFFITLDRARRMLRSVLIWYWREEDSQLYQA